MTINEGNRFGTVIVKKPLPIGEKGYTTFGGDDFTLKPDKHCNLTELHKTRDVR